MKHHLIIIFLTILFPFFGISQNMKFSTDTLTYVIDTNNSFLKWQCDNHNGIVPFKSGFIKIVNNEIVAGNFVMNMDSLKDLDINYDLMRKTLQNTLNSKFFFDTKKYHTSTFTFDYVEPLGENRYNITGDLWIKELVNCIQFKSTVTFNNKHLKATSDKFFIDRTRWGITIYSKQEVTSDNSVIVSNEIYFNIQLVGNSSL